MAARSWTEARIKELVDHLAAGRNLAQAARLMGVTSRAVYGAHWRHVKGNVEPRNGTRPSDTFRNKNNPHQNLVEPWAVYSARKKAERAAKKAAE